ncbi:hypothetical protein CO172_00945 [Candidatus Uhrbacteria bacterium CG_4_9_14_3_um_filter_36_7]|uniref:Uncharacterized protein n=1 Tax=Candidatus Uhrbacteria bacterium CG_4_9_14_3_um_filter_36_7 TaxID=1975033 RepID=A0A2M7XI50_9BACT|nr:MAG: hypothetical protein CO172_00945 [Candidatus Uhrbacteria bacterium CG_4_9_14_3_um_filter_36_7]
MKKEFLTNIEGDLISKSKGQSTSREGYRDLAKREIDLEQETNKNSLGMVEFQTLLNQRLALAAQKRGTSKETQQIIYEWQKKKQLIMLELKQALRELDDPEVHPVQTFKSRFIRYEDGRFYRPSGNRKDQIVTLGEIMTGASWGIDFYLDPQTVPRNIRKQFLIERVKQKLLDALNHQIMEEESESRFTHEWKRDTYKRIQEEKESGTEYEHCGLLAEKMVKNFLLGLSYDFPVSFRLMEADVHQDVEQKIDFIVQVETHQRGVGTNKQEKVTQKGIQFTIQRNQDVLAKKRQQIERSRRSLGEDIDDIIFVNIPLEHVLNIYKQWKGAKQPAGGPEKLWDAKTKVMIFRGIMQGILSQEEIEKTVEQFVYLQSA